MNLKKIAGAFCALLAASIICSPFNVAAQSVSDKTLPQTSGSDLFRKDYTYEKGADGKFEYAYLPDNHDSIINYLGKDSKVTVPAEIDYYTMYAVGDSAFKDRTDIKSVTISEGIVEIGVYAFSGCTGLEELIVPQSVKKIRNFALESCDKVTICGYNGTYAESYAKENSIPFKSLGNVVPEKSDYDEDDDSESIPENINIKESVTLYAINERVTSLTIPDNLEKTYKIKLSGNYKNIEYSVISGKSVKVDENGLVEPDGETTIYVFSNESGIEYNYGRSIVKVSADKDVFYYEFNVENYVETYCDDVVQKYMDENITDSMTDMEKLEKVCQFVAGYDYSANASSRCGMILNNGGDCWASTDTVNYMCDKLGFFTIWRDAHNDPGAGSGHRNSIVVLNDGTSYMVECGYVGKAPRNYDITKYPDNYVVTGNYYAKILDDNTLSIAMYRGEEKEDIAVPKAIGGMKVSEIGEGVFENFTELKSIRLPDGLTSIGRDAFLNCSCLEKIEFPDTLISVGERAFSGTPWYENHTDGLITAGGVILKWKGDMPENYDLVVPDGIAGIADEAFYFCRELGSVKLPDSLKIIGSEVFRGCTELREIVLPESVESIGQYAFTECSNLKSVTFPKKIKSVDSFLFWNCPSLEKVSLPEGMTHLEDFNGCDSLREVYIPSTIDDISCDSSSFYDCPMLEKITVSPQSKSYVSDDGVLLNIERTKIILYPPKRQQDSFTIPESITDICGAFRGSRTLKSVNIPKTVTSLNNETFIDCSALLNIKVDAENAQYCDIDGVLYNKDKTELIAFPNGKTGSYSIPDGTESIGPWAFYGCKGITEIKLPSGIKSLEEAALYGCDSLQEITIPEGVERLGYKSLSSCVSLGIVRLPKSLTYVSDFIDSYGTRRTIYYAGTTKQWTDLGMESEVDSINIICSDSASANGIYYSVNDDGNLNIRFFDPDSEKITIPAVIEGKTVEQFDFTLLRSLPKLKEITVDPKNKNYSSADGILLDKSGETLLVCPAAKEGAPLKLPSTVKNIDEGAFSSCNAIISLVVPDSMTEIKNGEFSYLKSLKSVILPEKVTTIGSRAFADCTSLESVKLPESLTSLEDGAFSGCTSLSSINIPSCLYSIGENVFNGCKALKSITIPKNIESIYDYAFEDSGLESIVIPGTCRYVNSAFRNCENLKTVKIEEGVESLAGDAFSYCPNLESVELPKSLDQIGYNYSYWTGTTESPVFKGSDKVVIKCFECTAAYEYAMKNGLTVESLGHNDDGIIKVSGTLPTCTEAGTTDGSHCIYCGKVFKQQETLPAVGHDFYKGVCTICGEKEEAHAADTSSEKVDSENIISDNDTKNVSDNDAASDSAGTSSDTAADTDSGNESTDNNSSDNLTETDTQTAEKTDTETDSKTETEDTPTVSSDTDNPKVSEDQEHSDKTDKPDEPTDDTPEIMMGDVDNDGSITSADALMILRSSLGLLDFSDNERKAADCDGDGDIASADALFVLRKSLGM